jgi:hypothetical protein
MISRIILAAALMLLCGEIASAQLFSMPTFDILFTRQKEIRELGQLIGLETVEEKLEVPVPIPDFVSISKVPFLNLAKMLFQQGIV